MITVSLLLMMELRVCALNIHGLTLMPLSKIDRLKICGSIMRGKLNAPIKNNIKAF